MKEQPLRGEIAGIKTAAGRNAAAGLLEADRTLLEDLELLSVPPEITRFTRWNRDLQRALESIEEGAFPPELRYSYEEMRGRAGRPGFEGVLLFGPGGGATAEEKPEPRDPATPRGATAIMFVYRLDTAVIYLDTLAVRHRGRGLGSAFLRFLIRRCTAAIPPDQVREIRLDTERATASPLIEYYRRFGFRVIAEDEAMGNTTMVLPVGFPRLKTPR